MGLTVTNTNAMNLLSIVNNTRNKQADVLTQLSTGYKINRGVDNPAGLIAMKSLDTELIAVDAALDNNARSNAMLAVADNSINEISSLLGEVETLVMASTSDAGLSAGERSANQAQIDQALASIDRIVGTTNFNGKRLLDGNLAISTTTTVDRTKIEALRIYSRENLDAHKTISVEVNDAAEVASTQFVDMSTNTLTADTVIEVVGTDGTATVELATSATAGEVTAAINAVSDQTGVTASNASGDIHLKTTGYGSQEFVAVNVLEGGTTAGNDMADKARSYGTDATVSINGVKASADGRDVYYNANGTSISFTLSTTLNTDGGSASFTIDKSRGGAQFQLGTSDTTRATIGIDSLATHNLGVDADGDHLNALKSGGDAALATDTAKALKIVRKAMTEVAEAQGRIGAFQKFNVQTSINSLNASKVSLSDARSVIADTDFAAASAELNRQSVLLNSGISLLGLANQQASQILSLIG